MNPNKIDWLFETQALVVSPPDKPFLYTSGLIGPYYINTHYLCGGKEAAQNLLSFIDKKALKQTFVEDLTSELNEIYVTHQIYRETIDASVQHIKQEIPVDSITYISGGQRRDWFFSPLIARALNKPLLFIFNDGTIVEERGWPIEDLSDAKILNVADLLTVGSSYVKKWIPAISKRGGELAFSYNVVDRLQKGIEILSEAGVTKTTSLFSIDQDFLNLARERKFLSAEQYSLVMSYLADPFTSMKDFLQKNPGYLEEVKNSLDEKTRKRAEDLISQNLYKL